MDAVYCWAARQIRVRGSHRRLRTLLLPSLVCDPCATESDRHPALPQLSLDLRRPVARRVIPLPIGYL